MAYTVKLAEDAGVDLVDIHAYVAGRQSLEAADAGSARCVDRPARHPPVGPKTAMIPAPS